MSRSAASSIPFAAAAALWAASTCNVAAAADDAPYQPVTLAGCNAQSKAPRLISTSAAEVPESIWAARSDWEAVVRFRVGEDGAPYRVLATIARGHDDAADIERITTDTFARYRFCLPESFSTQTDWLAHVRFVYRHLALKTGEGEMFIQMFAPTYSRDDLSERRAGTTRIAARYGADGRPTAVRITATSGDRVLDDKTVDSVTTNQLVFHDASTLKFPLTFEMPFNYVIR